jgi:hypothetical protein
MTDEERETHEVEILRGDAGDGGTVRLVFVAVLQLRTAKEQARTAFEMTARASTAPTLGISRPRRSLSTAI